METGQKNVNQAKKEQKSKTALELALEAYRRVKNKEMQLARARLDAQTYITNNLPAEDVSAFRKKAEEMDRRMEDKIGFVGYKEFQQRQAFEERLREHFKARGREEEALLDEETETKDEPTGIVQQV
jgi:hypothetical protein